MRIFRNIKTVSIILIACLLCTLFVGCRNTSTYIPTEKIEASMDGEKVPVYETANGTYQIIPTKNGQLNVTVTLINDQRSTRSIKITDVDMQAPKIRSSEHTDGNLIIYFGYKRIQYL